MRQWKSGRTNALKQSCPDIAIREPFPFKIVFEGKYFGKGNRVQAETALVTSVYQAFFYRALPYVPPHKTRPPWDYEYSCLLAYDASDDGSLQAAWKELPDTVRQGFWNGANIYVMILRGTVP
jgi:hypothetical protein